MNDFFNFQIPAFQSKYGTDWTSFQTIMEEYVDDLMAETYQLYWLNDVNKLSIRAAEIILNSLGISFDVNDTLAQKKYYIRSFLTVFVNKGLSDMYLDPQEQIVGIRGVVYLGINFGVRRWGYSRWPDQGGAVDAADMHWSSPTSVFNVYIDCKTSDNDELDLIVAVYRQGFMLPAFYQIYLIDSAFTVLRTV